MGVGDTIAQICIEKKPLEEFNVKRLFNYSLVGLVYVGPSLRIWYGGLDKMFPSSGRKLQYKKVLVDQGIFAPAFIASILTILMGINGEKPEAIKEKLKQDYKDILITNYKIWPAVMIVNFSFVPVNYQVLVTQTVAVLWNIYFAWKANQPVIKIE
ncbi:hypothetical protein R5R35_003292 [Gryllus longicercus]